MSTIPPVPPWTTEKEKIIYEIAFKHLSQFELYDSSHLIFVRSGHNGESIAYHTKIPAREPEATRTDLEVSTIGIIDWMGISPGVRRSGHGTLLYRRIEDLFTEAGCEAIELTPSGAGFPFWKKMGFKRHGGNLVPTYRKELKK